jgi:hypothetical protein
MLKFEIEEQELLDGLVDAIGALPEGHAEIDRREVAIGPRGRVDALIDARVGGQPILLLVEAKREAFPRDVRETVWQLRNYLAHMPHDDREILPFFIARAISPGARDILREEGVGFYDLGGSLFIPARHAFVYVDRPVPKKNAKIFDSVFQGQKARVVQAVFDRRSEWLSVKELAESTEVSPATASATLTEMERREWLDVEGAGPSKLRRLRSVKALVDAWTSYITDQKPPRLTRYYVPGGSAVELAQRLDRACQDADAAYTVTAEAAAQLYAPYLSSISQVKCRIEPGPRQAEALDTLNARPVSEGWNLGLIETRARGDVTVAECIDGVRLASPLQVYLDLLQGSGRSREMAAHLRAERLDA